MLSFIQDLLVLVCLINRSIWGMSPLPPAPPPYFDTLFILPPIFHLKYYVCLDQSYCTNSLCTYLLFGYRFTVYNDLVGSTFKSRHIPTGFTGTLLHVCKTDGENDSRHGYSILLLQTKCNWSPLWPCATWYGIPCIHYPTLQFYLALSGYPPPPHPAWSWSLHPNTTYIASYRGLIYNSVPPQCSSSTGYTDTLFIVLIWPPHFIYLSLYHSCSNLFLYWPTHPPR